eukprot:scaffold2560_cov116-Isochrysis_galbana.AAC.4
MPRVGAMSMLGIAASTTCSMPNGGVCPSVCVQLLEPVNGVDSRLGRRLPHSPSRHVVEGRLHTRCLVLCVGDAVQHNVVRQARRLAARLFWCRHHRPA